MPARFLLSFDGRRRRVPWIYEGTALVAAAGTHLLAREEGAAAIGNVYTRHDRRGRGLGRLTTSAVLGELSGVETIGLNVRADHEAALHLYESLGFARHCQFYEALAMPELSSLRGSARLSSPRRIPAGTSARSTLTEVGFATILG